jgi:SAM-dependent methyltransferase
LTIRRNEEVNGIAFRSFRDPGGRVFIVNGRVFRKVQPDAFSRLQSFLSTKAAKTLIANKQLVGTQIVETGKLLEHERVPFVSYPYEWPPEMLHSAAGLTLKIASMIADEDWRLKDATPYNVLFIGPKPVFIDVLSFEPRPPGDMVWLAAGQFLRTFVLPLLARKSFGVTLRDVLVNRRDGLPPEDLYDLCGIFGRLAPPTLSLVSIPAWLSRGRFSRAPSMPISTNPEKARFVFNILLRRLERNLKSVAPGETKSYWSNYSKSIEDKSYSEAKRCFVRESLERYAPKTGLDVGCNTGDFSCLAAQAGVSMVAIDSDPSVAGIAWRRALNHGLDILPLVIDITRPSPDLGWFNAESESFLARVHNRFEVVFLLAVMHHIAKDGIPLEEFVRMAHHVTVKLAVVELVEHNDTDFLDMVRGREELFTSYNRDSFEAQSAQYFEVISRRQVRPARWLYLLCKRT